MAITAARSPGARAPSGRPARIYIHKDVSEGRAQAMRDFGAEVIRCDGDYDYSVRLSREEADANGWFVVSDTSWDGYTQPPTDVMAGYGLMVDEIATQIGQPPTHLFVPSRCRRAGRGRHRPMRQTFAPDTRVVAVEPELAACLFASARAGAATTVAVEEETLMAGLSCGEPSALAWGVIAQEIGDFLTIPESLVGPAMRLAGQPLGSDPAIVAGESAVCGMAAMITAARRADLRAALGLDETSRVLLIGSEGATDPEIYRQIMDAA